MPLLMMMTMVTASKSAQSLQGHATVIAKVQWFLDQQRHKDIEELLAALNRRY